jgi:hypothetical protein
VKFDFRLVLMNTLRAELAPLTTIRPEHQWASLPKTLAQACGESAIKPYRLEIVMRENSDAVRLARVVGGVVVLAGLVASIAGCSGNGSNAPSTTQSPTTTTTTQSPAPGAPPPAPTEKSISPTGGNKFTPTVRAPMAPTAIPGNRENTG